jgi:TonB family protein
MMPDINAGLLAVSNSAAGSIVVKATVVAALGLTGARLARGSRAAVRHALLAVTFGALAALPLISLALPPIRIALRMAAQAAPIPDGPTGTVAAIAPAEARTAEPTQSPSLRLTPEALLLGAWMVGAALFLLPLVVGLWQVRRLRRTGLPWRHGQTIAEGLATEAGVHRRVEVLLHEALAGPMTCGAFDPAIVLPVDARNWKEEDLNRAFVHEIEHVRRGDWLSYCFVRAVCAAYWFHPLAWMARRQLVLEAERACDDAVLARSEATAYADQLVGAAERLLASARSPLLAMASRADLSKRVGAMLDGRQRRGRAGAAAVALACAAAAALVLTMAPLTVVAAPEAAVTNMTASAPILEPAPVPVAAAPHVPAARAQISKPAPVLMAAAPQAAEAPQAAPTAADLRSMPLFSGGAMLAMVDVTASDQNGNAIEGLQASDFVVTEDGAPQRIMIFEYQKVDSTDERVKSYYVLGYYPTNTELDGTYRKVNITLTGNTAAKLDYRARYSTLVQPTQAAGAPGPGVRFPTLQYKVEPMYAEAARKAKFQGTVGLLITVNADGTVGDINVIRTLGLGLDEKAVEAVKQWKFIPGMKDLVRVPMQARVVVTFRLT